MKIMRLSSRRPNGFTLVELLVVIGIIAILATALTFSAGVAIKAAKRAQASNTAVQIQTACQAYYTEYSVYPVASGTTGDSIITDAQGPQWATLDCVLAGNISPSTGTAVAAPSGGPLNNRAIAFLSLRNTDVFSAQDVTVNPSGTQDAPKNPLPTSKTANLFYNIAFDSDYSGVIGDASSSAQIPNFATAVTGTDPTTGGTSTAGIAVWANCNGDATTKNPTHWVHTY